MRLCFIAKRKASRSKAETKNLIYGGFEDSAEVNNSIIFDIVIIKFMLNFEANRMLFLVGVS